MTTPSDTRVQRAANRLRDHLAQGMSLEEAIRKVHREETFGKMWLWPAVMTLQRVTKEDAMRIVVQATAGLRGE